jgi:hypothetical protein
MAKDSTNIVRTRIKVVLSVFNYFLFLGASAKLRKATISFVMSHVVFTVHLIKQLKVLLNQHMHYILIFLYVGVIDLVIRI